MSEQEQNECICRFIQTHPGEGVVIVNADCPHDHGFPRDEHGRMLFPAAVEALEADLAAARKRIEDERERANGNAQSALMFVARAEAAERRAEQWREFVTAIRRYRTAQRQMARRLGRGEDAQLVQEIDAAANALDDALRATEEDTKALRAAGAPPTAPVDLREQATVRDTLRQLGGGEEYD